MSPENGERVFELGRRVRDLNYSLRRYFVDRFHFLHVPGFREGGRVLNLGGLAVLRRGVFRIDPYGFRVVHLNLSPKFRPEVIGDGAALPFGNRSFDAVIISEVLEHVPEPGLVLAEAARVLTPGGRVLITVPFLNPIHADPVDYGRYTDTFLLRALDRAGLDPLTVEPQGDYLAVLADLLRDWLNNRERGGFRARLANRLVGGLVVRLRSRAAEPGRSPSFGRNYPTGYGILAQKP